jgi:hypothetical protein
VWLFFGSLKVALERRHAKERFSFAQGGSILAPPQGAPSKKKILAKFLSPSGRGPSQLCLRP